VTETWGTGPAHVTEFIVSAGSGHNPYRSFPTEAEALRYAQEEASVPSYFGPGHKRQVSVIRRETITSTIWKAR
jgi:hypothetical protein